MHNDWIKSKSSATSCNRHASTCLAMHHDASSHRLHIETTGIFNALENPRSVNKIEFAIKIILENKMDEDFGELTEEEWKEIEANKKLCDKTETMLSLPTIKVKHYVLKKTIFIPILN